MATICCERLVFLAKRLEPEKIRVFCVFDDVSIVYSNFFVRLKNWFFKVKIDY